MLKNYLKIAWRNLLKNKTFSIINIAGLAIGLACFLLIALYVADELSYDRYNINADRIYRVNTDLRFGGSDMKLAVCSDPMAATLKRDYPQVEDAARIYASSGSKLIKKGTVFIEEQRVANADSTLFNIFTLPAIEGDTQHALSEPNSVVITESMANKYFGSTHVTGKIIETSEQKNNLYKITAVIKDIPHNSHFNFDFLFSMHNLNYDFGHYLNHNFQTYVLLKKGTDYKAFDKNFVQVVEKYVLPQAKQFMQISSMEAFRKSGNNLEYHLMPVTDIHLKSGRFPELDVNGSMQYVYIFSAVALFILLIACINFMNLSTARSASRSKEVGIRKVLGTNKKSLVWQFLTESTMMVFIALTIALFIASLIMPFFNDVSSKSLTIATLFSYKTLPFLLLLPFVVGALAGSYPAFFLSSFQPIAVLKGKVNAGFKKSSLRSGLVIFQFAISIVLIIGVTIIYNQLNYIQTKKLGFNKDQVLILNGTGALDKNAEVFKNEVAKMNGIKSASFGGYLPVNGSSRSDDTYSTGAVLNDKNAFSMQSWSVDYDYINTLGMELSKGRNFSREFKTDSSAVIINETAAKMLGYNNPIGKKIYTFTNDIPPQSIAYTVIGVVKDFHFESLRQTIGPLCMRMANNSWATVFKVSTTDIKGLLKNIETKWKTMAPGMPFNYQFLDESFDNMYRAEQRIGKIALAFAILTILIACLGLFGLATYMAEQRTKEIGVRKVLGASVSNLISMLSKDFLKLVLVAALLAFPIAWYAMHKWLQDFAFKVNISWWVFILAGVISVSIAILAVSSQAIKAALNNPVKSLRTE